MKKFGKFVFGTLSVAAAAAGAYYVYKNFIKNDSSDDFDEFEDDFDEFDDLETEEDSDETNGREYVSIQMDQESANDNSEISDDNAVETE